MCNLLNALSVWFAASLIDLTHYLDRFSIFVRLQLFYRSLMSSNSLRRLRRFYRMKRAQRKSAIQKNPTYRLTLMSDFKVTLIDKNGKRIVLRWLCDFSFAQLFIEQHSILLNKDNNTRKQNKIYGLSISTNRIHWMPNWLPSFIHKKGWVVHKKRKKI